MKNNDLNKEDIDLNNISSMKTDILKISMIGIVCAGVFIVKIIKIKLKHLFNK